MLYFSLFIVLWNCNCFVTISCLIIVLLVPSIIILCYLSNDLLCYMEPSYLLFDCSYIHWITPVYGFLWNCNQSLSQSIMNVPGGSCTHNLRKQSGEDPGLIPTGNWDRHFWHLVAACWLDSSSTYWR